MSPIGSKVWETKTPKNTKEVIVGFYVEENFKGRFMVEDGCREPIKEVSSGLKGMISKMKG